MKLIALERQSQRQVGWAGRSLELRVKGEEDVENPMIRSAVDSVSRITN